MASKTSKTYSGWGTIIVTIVLVLFSVTLVHSVPYDVRSLCPGVCPVRVPPGSAEGVFWTVLATNSSTGQCGLLNNQCPCKCTGYKLCSRFPPPSVPEYNITSFGYNTEERCYDEQFFALSRVDRNQPWGVFNITDKRTGATAILAGIDTDDHQNFIIVYLCNVRTADGRPIINVVSRHIEGLSRSHQKRIDAVLRGNHLCPEDLIVVNRRNCPYYL